VCAASVKSASHTVPSISCPLHCHSLFAYAVCLSGQQQTAEVLWGSLSSGRTTWQAKRHMQRLQLEALLSPSYLPC
jgi:hypothetical protein